jgi:hypothetical protein
LLGGRTLGALGLLGLLGGAVKVALDPTGIIGIAELGTSAAPVGFGLLQKCGWVRAGYTGTQWPYLYAFGREASGRRREDLERALRDASC